MYKKALILILVLSGIGTAIKGQELVRTAKIAGKSYASNKVNKIFIPPPREFYLKQGGKGAHITVYYSGFTIAAKAAYDHAVSILASILPDNTSFTVRATWAPLSGTSILASTGVGSYVGGVFIDALNPSAYYPVALASKISGKNMSLGSDGDVVMSVNSRIAWYTGIDGHPAANTYDLVTVVLHELLHGIGFTDSFTVSGTRATYGFGSFPSIYDTFAQDVNGQYLTDSTAYSNNSSMLYKVVTGGNLFFKGKVLANRAKLYAPSIWDAGSSISHLNETSYESIPDALMTPFLAKQEAIHSPGPVIRAILGEIGWINTRIIHTPFTDTEQNLSQVTFNTVIKSDTSYAKDKVGLVYSFDKFSHSNTVYLDQLQSGDSFRISLALPSYNTQVSYYFYATDYFGRIYRLPSKGESSPYSFIVGSDTVKPTLTHIPPDYFIDKVYSLKLKASASDNIGIDTVFAEYRKSDGLLSYLGLNHDSLDIYSNSIDIRSMEMTETDSLMYRIVAVDSSSQANKTYSPATGYYTIKPEKTFEAIESFTTNFSGSENNFINRGFSIITPLGFSDPALHTKHPYESPEKDNDSIVYTSVLRYPLNVDDSVIIISYMEIVLVEPGESGSVYGSPYFYDYVVVEASKDYGETWFTMADGYDSRISTSFLENYNSSTDGSNSTFAGTASMFRKHIISVSTFNKFNKGDTLLLRFRLFSDPYAHGWGWAVDDLTIKSVASGVPGTEITDLKIYPNPGTGLIKVLQSNATGQEAEFHVVNLIGVEVKNGKITPGNNGEIDISSQPSGLYIVWIRSGNKVYTFRYTKIN
jgi:hypothetical protein